MPVDGTSALRDGNPCWIPGGSAGGSQCLAKPHSGTRTGIRRPDQPERSAKMTVRLRWVTTSRAAASVTHWLACERSRGAIRMRRRRALPLGSVERHGDLPGIESHADDVVLSDHRRAASFRRAARAASTPGARGGTGAGARRRDGVATAAGHPEVLPDRRHGRAPLGNQTFRPRSCRWRGARRPPSVPHHEQTPDVALGQNGDLRQVPQLIHRPGVDLKLPLTKPAHPLESHLRLVL